MFRSLPFTRWGYMKYWMYILIEIVLRKGSVISYLHATEPDKRDAISSTDNKWIKPNVMDNSAHTMGECSSRVVNVINITTHGFSIDL